jgi:hypothetical protein
VQCGFQWTKGLLSHGTARKYFSAIRGIVESATEVNRFGTRVSENKSYFTIPPIFPMPIPSQYKWRYKGE